MRADTGLFLVPEGWSDNSDAFDDTPPPPPNAAVENIDTILK